MPPRGRCVRCGRRYIGWALLQSTYKECACGGRIILEEEPNADRISNNRDIPRPSQA